MSAKAHSPKRHWPKGVLILHEDRDILVVEKPPGLLTMGTDRFETETLYHKLTDYVRKGNSKSRERVFIVHRLDREASGILVFARHEEAQACLQDQWEDVAKRYVAVVYGTVKPKADTITSYLAENVAHVVYSTRDAAKGKLSRTAYRVVRERNESEQTREPRSVALHGRRSAGDETRRYMKTETAMSLLEIDLLTGRKHQIRVHLADKGNPIVGDRKYGKAAKPHKHLGGEDKMHRRDRSADRLHKRLALHAFSLSFHHPATGERVTFETKIPRYFTDLMSFAVE